MTYGKYRDMANWLRGKPTLGDYTDGQLAEAIDQLLVDVEHHAAEHARWRKVMLDQQLDGQR